MAVEGKSRPKLGEWRTFSSHAVKTHPTDSTTVWVNSPMDTKRGMYVGYRTVLSGKWMWSGDPDIDGAREFHPDKRHVVWLFETDERHNPVRVFPECVEAQS